MSAPSTGMSPRSRQTSDHDSSGSRSHSRSRSRSKPSDIVQDAILNQSPAKHRAEERNQDVDAGSGRGQGAVKLRNSASSPSPSNHVRRASHGSVSRDALSSSAGDQSGSSTSSPSTTSNNVDFEQASSASGPTSPTLPSSLSHSVDEPPLSELLPPDILKQAMKSKGAKLQVDRSKALQHIDVSAFAKSVKSAINVKPSKEAALYDQLLAQLREHTFIYKNDSDRVKGKRALLSLYSSLLDQLEGSLPSSSKPRPLTRSQRDRRLQCVVYLVQRQEFDPRKLAITSSHSSATASASSASSGCSSSSSSGLTSSASASTSTSSASSASFSSSISSLGSSLSSSLGSSPHDNHAHSSSQPESVQQGWAFLRLLYRAQLYTAHVISDAMRERRRTSRRARIHSFTEGAPASSYQDERPDSPPEPLTDQILLRFAVHLLAVCAISLPSSVLVKQLHLVLCSLRLTTSPPARSISSTFSASSSVSSTSSSTSSSAASESSSQAVSEQSQAVDTKQNEHNNNKDKKDQQLEDEEAEKEEEEEEEERAKRRALSEALVERFLDENFQQRDGTPRASGSSPRDVSVLPSLLQHLPPGKEVQGYEREAKRLGVPWLMELFEQRIYYYLFLEKFMQQPRTVVRSGRPIPWKRIPGYADAITPFLYEFALCDASSSDPNLITVSKLLLVDQSLLSVFIQMILPKTNVHDFRETIQTISVLSGWFQHDSFQVALPEQFDFVLFLNALKILLESPHFAILTETLTMIYNFLHLFGKRRIPILQLLTTEIFFYKFFLHWDYYLRDLFVRLLLFRVMGEVDEELQQTQEDAKLAVVQSSKDRLKAMVTAQAVEQRSTDRSVLRKIARQRIRCVKTQLEAHQQEESGAELPKKKKSSRSCSNTDGTSFRLAKTDLVYAKEALRQLKAVKEEYNLWKKDPPRDSAGNLQYPKLKMITRQTGAEIGETEETAPQLSGASFRLPITPRDTSGQFGNKNPLSRSGGKKKRRLSLQKIGALVSNSERRERSKQKNREGKDSSRNHSNTTAQKQLSYSPSPPLSADEEADRVERERLRERARSESPPMDLTPLSRAAKSADYSRQALAARSARGPKSSRHSARRLSAHSGDKSKVSKLRDRFRL